MQSAPLTSHMEAQTYDLSPSLEQIERSSRWAKWIAPLALLLAVVHSYDLFRAWQSGEAIDWMMVIPVIAWTAVFVSWTWQARQANPSQHPRLVLGEAVQIFRSGTSWQASPETIDRVQIRVTEVVFEGEQQKVVPLGDLPYAQVRAIKEAVETWAQSHDLAVDVSS